MRLPTKLSRAKMTPQERTQQRTDDAWKEYEERQNVRRFQTYEDTTPEPEPVKRYRYFQTQEDTYADPIIGPMMIEEDEREWKGYPPRFSLL